MRPDVLCLLDHRVQLIDDIRSQSRRCDDVEGSRCEWRFIVVEPLHDFSGSEDYSNHLCDGCRHACVGIPFQGVLNDFSLPLDLQILLIVHTSHLNCKVVQDVFIQVIHIAVALSLVCVGFQLFELLLECIAESLDFRVLLWPDIDETAFCEFNHLRYLRMPHSGSPAWPRW